ncbi:hypothetical protein [Micromonospora carbonacea]|uniref:Uncharacterized protein n=1 Tax=Micromonospora carbonacea TaxID=47853 RepID=A0A7H8XPB9_9ACTN|nr:hypothetical protein [Micromonospora carbonacea]MBB5825961.1 hypothetical protein [Micromonospora carbonacea]QLD25551.1 hypothetical protein HXZ27_16155 [Micromonospora carbonacea]
MTQEDPSSEAETEFAAPGTAEDPVRIQPGTGADPTPDGLSTDVEDESEVVAHAEADDAEALPWCVGYFC